MKNITVSVDDVTYRKARIEAARRETSVSALVRSYLSELAEHESEIDKLKNLEREIRKKITAFSASDRLNRDELHGRSL